MATVSKIAKTGGDAYEIEDAQSRSDIAELLTAVKNLEARIKELEDVTIPTLQNSVTGGFESCQTNDNSIGDRINEILDDAKVVTVEHGGTGNSKGTAASLTTPRNIVTDLQSVQAASFDGTQDVTIGSTGVLPVEKGGTGATSDFYARNSLGAVSGIWPITCGGTNMTSNPSMLVNLASGSADGVFNVAPRPGVIGTLPVAKGGTGATSAASARENLGVANRATYNYIYSNSIFSGKTVSGSNSANSQKGTYIGQYTTVFNYRMFLAAVTNNKYLIGWRSGSETSDGIITLCTGTEAYDSVDDGTTDSRFILAEIYVEKNGKLYLRSSGGVTVDAGAYAGAWHAYNLKALYGLS